jgi:sporulation protein YlmC with PRC-barrel domain
MASAVSAADTASSTDADAPQAALAIPLDPRDAEAALPFHAGRLGLIKAGTDLIGEKVTDTEHKTVGKIRDLMLDVSAGQLVAALIDSGGKTPLTPVPARNFEDMPDGKPHLGSSRENFKGAPHYPRNWLGGALGTYDLSDSFRHFNPAAPKAPATHPRVQPASILRGQRVLGQTGEPLGRLEDIMVDLAEGRIVYLLIEPPAGVETSGDLYLVPPASVKSDPDGQTLLINTDLAHFLAGHHFEKDFPTEMNLPQVAVAVYKHYGLLLPAPKPGSAPVAAHAALQGPATLAQQAAARQD